MFASAGDLLKKTPAFWENYVKLKLDRDFSGQFRHFNEPASNANYYLDRIESNIAHLRQRLAADTSFYKK